MANNDTKTIKEIVSTLKSTFQTGITKQVKWRREQLNSLLRLLNENSLILEEALKNDLGKSSIESQLTEISFLKKEIKYTLKKLNKWIKPKRKIMPLMLQPAFGRVIYEPLGVALIIAPWNYPLMLVLSPLVGALAAGNCVLLKPSELASNISKIITELIPKYLDNNAIKVLEGDAEFTKKILEERFDYIFYTGNSNVGKYIAKKAAEYLTPITLELGGKSPVFIDKSVNLKTAADRIVWGKFINAGQTCVAPDYVLATKDILDELTANLAKSLKKMYGTSPKNNHNYCRIINSRHLHRLQSLLDDVKQEQIIVGGDVDENDNYFAPTIINNVSKNSKIMEDEIFGPILPIIYVDDFDEALAYILSKEKPLALYAFTNDEKAKKDILSKTSSGAIGFNIPVVHLSALNLPFGGVGFSGKGAYHGKYSFETFSHLKPVLTKPLWLDTMRLIYVPYGYLTKLVIKIFMG